MSVLHAVGGEVASGGQVHGGGIGRSAQQAGGHGVGSEVLDAVGQFQAGVGQLQTHRTDVVRAAGHERTAGADQVAEVDDVLVRFQPESECPVGRPVAQALVVDHEGGLDLAAAGFCGIDGGVAQYAAVLRKYREELTGMVQVAGQPYPQDAGAGAGGRCRTEVRGDVGGYLAGVGIVDEWQEGGGDGLAPGRTEGAVVVRLQGEGKGQGGQALGAVGGNILCGRAGQRRRFGIEHHQRVGAGIGVPRTVGSV